MQYLFSSRDIAILRTRICACNLLEDQKKRSVGEDQKKVFTLHIVGHNCVPSFWAAMVKNLRSTDLQSMYNAYGSNFAISNVYFSFVIRLYL